MKRWPQALLALSAALVAPAAEAHLVETGFGAFYDGIAHLAMTPSDLMMVLALALLAGQRGTAAARWALFALPLAWLVGGLAGVQWPGAGALPLWTTLSFLLAGALVALGARVQNMGVASLAVPAGTLHGFVNGATMGPAGVLALRWHSDGGVLPGRDCRRRSHGVARRMAAHRGSRRRELDRSRRSAHAGLARKNYSLSVSAWRPALAASMELRPIIGPSLHPCHRPGPEKAAQTFWLDQRPLGTPP